jgi:PET assembly of cytochrome c oxidase, mitochondrial
MGRALYAATRARGGCVFVLEALTPPAAARGLKAEQVMYQGVIRDDARRAAKLRERGEALEASREKQRTYERVQKVAEGAEVAKEEQEQ